MNKENKKIGVLTMHAVVNYGSFLQAYATQKSIEKIGHNCEIIDYIFPNEFHLRKLPLLTRVRLKLTNIIYKLGLTSGHRKAVKLKNANKKYLNLSAEYRNRDSIISNPPIYDTYVTGSDQTWNVKHTEGDATFFLDFAPEEKRKISFSASLASKELSSENYEFFSKNLSRYDDISIRDSNGNKIIKKTTGKEASVTLDPTLLLNEKEWENFANNEKNKFSNKKYIVFYLITHSFDPRPYIYELLKDIQKSTGYEVYTFSAIPDKFEIKQTLCTDISAEDFIHLFINASYVVTSSFHGTAFAVNFGIPLYSIVNDVNSGDDRQLSLLKKLNLENCLVTPDDKYESINPEFNKDSQQLLLAKMRELSMNYLKESL